MEIFQSLYGGDLTILDGASGDSREHPSGKPQCRDNNASGVPGQLVTEIGNKSPNDLQYMMREGRRIDLFDLDSSSHTVCP